MEEKKLSVIQSEDIDLIPLSSLEKVFRKKESLTAKEIQKVSAMQSEAVSFQCAYRYKTEYYSSQMRIQATKNPSVTAELVLPEGIRGSIRQVGYVPSMFPAYAETDSDYITTEPGLFPDPLEPLQGSFQIIPYYYRSLWIELIAEEGVCTGEYPVAVVLKTLDGTEIKRATILFQVIGCRLPEQELIHTEWFHADCLANYYGVTVFSEEHWKIMGNFMRTARKRGINMIYTPLFTPPLDTLIGGYRTPVQLIDVTRKSDGTYWFGFEKFHRWIELGKNCGFDYFEMSHLFSQWGAKYAVAVYAFDETENREIRLFGWENRADEPEYLEFLRVFLIQLKKEIKGMEIEKNTFFHVSDEPNAGNIDTFRTAARFLKEQLSGYPIIDALSTLQYYEEKLIELPIPTNVAIPEFLEYGMEHPWVYYCSGEYLKVSNRFFAMPSARQRILGVQMYLYNVEGFLHWGYNFYNSQYSIRPLNPYLETDSGMAFPSGDAFIVYPGEDGTPVESLRLLVMEEAINDLRALTLLERYKGKAYVHDLIRSYARMEITFSEYPSEPEFLLSLRERVNEEIKSCLESLVLE